MNLPLISGLCYLLGLLDIFITSTPATTPATTTTKLNKKVLILFSTFLVQKTTKNFEKRAFLFLKVYDMIRIWPLILFEKDFCLILGNKKFKKKQILNIFDIFKFDLSK